MIAGKQSLAIPLMISAVLLALPLSAAIGGDASRGGAFLPMGWDARGEGLAGAAALLIRDDRSAYWNPANLTYLRSVHLSLATTKPVPDMDNWYNVLSIGTGLMEMRPAEQADSVQSRFGAAFIVGHLDVGLAEGSHWRETTFGIAGALAVNYFNSIGFTWRVLESRVDFHDGDASGMALDAAWTTRLSERIWLGVVGRNVAGTLSFPNRNEELDRVWNLAIAWEHVVERASIEYDVVLRDGELARVIFGTDVTVFRDLLSLLGGVDFRFTDGKRTILHFGVATRLQFSEIAIASTFDPEDAFGRKTRVSISFFPF